MTPLLPIVMRDLVVRVFLVVVPLATVTTGLASSSTSRTASGVVVVVALVVVALGGAAASAAVWGSVHEAELEETVHHCGGSGFAVRRRIFFLLLLLIAGSLMATTVIAFAGISVRGGAFVHAASGQGGMKELLAALAGAMVSVPLATMIAWRRGRTQAVGITAFIVLVPIVVQFGPRLSGREVVLALAPTMSPTVLATAGTHPAPLVSLAAASALLPWLAAVFLLVAVRPAGAAAVPVAFAHGQGANRTRGRGSLTRRPRLSVSHGVAALVLFIAVSAVAPAWSERLPYDQRYAAGVQASREQGPENAVRAFITSLAAGRVVTASAWTVGGDATYLVRELPASFAQRVQYSRLSLVESADIRQAKVRIHASGAEFDVALIRPGRQWLVASITGASRG